METQKITAEFVREALPPRRADGHKGDFGKVLIAGGAVGYTGAPYLAALGAARSGCGLVYLGVPSCIWTVTAAKCVCAMPFPLPEEGGMLAERAAAPLLERLGVPAETVPLMLLRPFSGSGALAAASEVIGHAGPDSLAGRTAAVMMGSTETTFYVIAVYFGAAGVRKTRHAIPAALCADLTGFLMAAWTTRWFFGG